MKTTYPKLDALTNVEMLISKEQTQTMIDDTIDPKARLEIIFELEKIRRSVLNAMLRASNE